MSIEIGRSSYSIILILVLFPLLGSGQGTGDYEPLDLIPDDEWKAPEPRVEEMDYRAPLRSYGVEEGLMHGSIRSLLIDRKGYLWIGTFGGGVFRFDGSDFERFGLEDGLPSERVLSLHQDRKGGIWIGTVKGLSRFDGNSLETYVEEGGCEDVLGADCKEKLLAGVIYDITEDDDGGIWAASAGGGVVRIDDGGFEYYVPRGGCTDTLDGECVDVLPGWVARTVEEGPDGRIWIGTFEEGMVAHNEERTDYFGNEEGCKLHGEHYRKSTELPIGSNVFWSSDLDEQGRLWIGTPQGLLRKDGTDWTLFRDDCKGKPFCEEIGLPNHLVTGIEQISDSSYWISTYRGAAKMVRDSIARSVLSKNGLSGQHVNDLEKGGTLWIGDQGGLEQYLSDAIELFDHRGGLVTDRVQAMVKDDRGRVWLGSSDGDGVLSRWDGGERVEHIMGKKELEQKGITDLFQGRDGSIWVATNGGGIYRYREGRIEHFGRGRFNKGNIFGVHETQEGDLWVIGEAGATRFTNDSTEHFGMEDGLSHSHLTSIAEDGSGRIWTGTPLAGINIHQDGEFIVLRDGRGLRTDRVKDIERGAEGGMWVATYGDGLQVMRSPENLKGPQDAEWELITKGDGLPSDQVKGLHFDEKERLWVATELGAAQVDPASGKVLRTLERSNGFLGLNCTGAICSDDQGRVLFGTAQHLIRYDPSKDRRDTIHPQLHIEEVNVGFASMDWHAEADSLRKELGIKFDLEKGNPVPQSLSIPYDRSQIVIGFRAIDLRSPDEVRYRYRLEGTDREWSPWQKENKAVFNDLTAGSYRFEVEAKAGEGLRSKEIQSFEFRIRPAWWNSTWFRTGSVATLALMAFLIFRWRTAAIRKRKFELEEKVEERTEEVERHRAELATKNQEITDSIDYASSIQKALFPERSVLQNALGEHFVLYRPRDPVSGDFYWCYAPSPELAIWIVADCTGHGVPGAFMSVMGSNLLDEVVVKDGEWDVGKILGRLRERIIEKLGPSRRDGMEASLCLWDKVKGELHFAGANAPLFLVRKNLAYQDPDFKLYLNGELVDGEERYQPFRDNVNGGEFRGDQQKITAEEGMGRGPFHRFVLSLESGDRIYTFTDGFPDQFGGPKDKKYGRRRFKRILTANAFQPMEEQHEDLDQNLREWQGEREQIDDICVMGVHIDDPAPVASRSTKDDDG